MHSGRQTLCLVMVNNVCCHVEKARALKHNCYCRMDCNYMLFVKHIVFISI